MLLHSSTKSISIQDLSLTNNSFLTNNLMLFNNNDSNKCHTNTEAILQIVKEIKTLVTCI